MIEFTILEMTLMALCAALFFRNARNATKAKALFSILNMMCEDERVMVEVRKQHTAVFKRKTQ